MKVMVGAIGLFLATSVYAGPREQAKKLYDRIAGVPPTEATLSQMEQLLANGNFRGAADLAMGTETFYAITVKNMAAKWTNTDENLDVPLNDYTATVIGMIRDEISFDQLLYGDIIYTAAAGTGVAPYSLDNNDHYQNFEDRGLSYLGQLVQSTQSDTSGMIDPAGVFSTRAWGAAYYSAGTNRRPIRFASMTFLCKDMEQLSDVTIADAYVRRDVDRAPGGDAKGFRNKCAGCHSGMDPLSKAFSRYDFVDGSLVYEPGQIPEKVNRNGSTFPAGYVTNDDNWVLLWHEGQNATVGWNGAKSGTGAASLGKMLSETDAFPLCMAQRVFNKVCLRGPASQSEVEAIKTMSQEFKDGGYVMKDLFADAAEVCITP